MPPGEEFLLPRGAGSVIPAVPVVPVSHKGTSLHLTAYRILAWHHDAFGDTSGIMPKGTIQRRAPQGGQTAPSSALVVRCSLMLALAQVEN